MTRVLKEVEYPLIAETIIRESAIPLRLDESRAAQDGQLLREIRLGPPEDSRQMTDTCLSVTEGGEDGQPPRVGERPHQPGFGEERQRHCRLHRYAGFCIYRSL